MDFSFAKRVVSSVRLYIDGTFVDGLYCNYPKPAKYPSHSIKNVQTSATTTKSLQFSNVELTKDDEYLDADVPEESNTIKLRFKNATFIEPTGTSCVNKRKQEGA